VSRPSVSWVERRAAWRGSLVTLGVMLVVAVAIRLLALQLPGHSGDVRVIVGWTERIVEDGSLAFYEGSASIYPALLYLLWPLGLVLQGDALSTAIKALSIPFDVGIGVVLFAVLSRRAGQAAGLAAAALYLFNPGAVIAGPIWGQVDAAGTLAMLGALAATAGRRHAFGGAFAVLATLLKPQFGIAVLAVGGAAAVRTWRERRIGPLAWTVVGGAWMYGIVAGPLALSPGRYLELLGGAADRQPMTSLHAFNPWAVIAGFDVPDDPYVGIGAALLLGGLIVSLLPLRRRTDLATLLAVGGMLAMSLYFLPTRVHERYLFPVLALLAPFAATELRLRIPYVVMSLAYGVTLLYALDLTTRFDLPAGIASVLALAPMVWLLTLVLMASAFVFFAVFLTDRRLALRTDAERSARAADHRQARHDAGGRQRAEH
jgi:dolichyl-phosphate-mannose-protein mannosyltransferase